MLVIKFKLTLNNQKGGSHDPFPAVLFHKLSVDFMYAEVKTIFGAIDGRKTWHSVLKCDGNLQGVSSQVQLLMLSFFLTE